MSKTLPSIGDIIEEMYQSILATPKRQRRLRSATFWDKFGFKVRTKERVEQVKAILRRRSLVVNLDDATFGTEAKDDWIILSFVEPELPPQLIPTATSITVPTPSDAWFTLIEQRVFESEREVEYYFVVPILEQLGYTEDDLAIGFPVQMYEGVKKVNKEADFVLFNGPSRAKEDALLIIEAKKSDKLLSEDAAGQARAYAIWLITPYYLVTNGDDIRIYLFRGAVQPDVMLMALKRSELRQQWPALYQIINRSAVIEYKQRLNQPMPTAGG
jgi:hypothetical protein